MPAKDLSAKSITPGTVEFQEASKEVFKSDVAVLGRRRTSKEVAAECILKALIYVILKWL